MWLVSQDRVLSPILGIQMYQGATNAALGVVGRQGAKGVAV